MFLTLSIGIGIMVNRSEQIDKELKFLYTEEQKITDQIQDLLQEKLKLQQMDSQLVEMARFKSKHGIGKR